MPVSLNIRQALYAEQTGEVPVVLATITHPDLATPVRLSSDPTQRLSIEPLRYGTISNGETFEFVLMSAVLPDQQRGQSPRAALVFENVERDSVGLLRSITTPMRIRLDLVLASAPNVLEESYVDLRGMKAGYDADKITLDISREPFTSEPWPAGKATQARLPGLHR
ncbi:DUF1833 family protein [Bosea eneae]|uniref:DUF1833 family protein n=1 Tax=Bosea eneae TaxID=151454 RepID=A0ABW0IW91_9HYPH